MTDWKPGDVAMVTGRWVIDIHHTTRRAYRDSAEGWSELGGSRQVADWEVSSVRPLAVVDPENPEDVKRLAKAWDDLRDGHAELGPDPMPLSAYRMQAALREFAAPTPPKPTEPLGLGAVVEDADGERWVRVEPQNNPSGFPMQAWRNRVPLAEARILSWPNIDAVRTLSEGVTE